MIRLYLMRHGVAIDREDSECPSDPERWLTDGGVARTRAACRGIARLGLDVDRAASSDYRRARETLAIALGELSLDLAVAELAALQPEGDPRQATRRVAALGGSSVLCVGHAPQLDAWLGQLVGSRGPITALKKAGLACLTLERFAAGAATLTALYTPRVLRDLGA